MSDVISLSSDEEYETPAKKIKQDLLENKSVVNTEAEKNDTNHEKNGINLKEVFMKNESLPSLSPKKKDPVFIIDESEEEEAIENVKAAETENGKADNPEGTKSDELVEQTEPSTSSEVKDSFKLFLDICKDSIKDSQYESRLLPKFSKLEEMFKQNWQELEKDESFKTQLSQNTELAKLSAAYAVVSFKNVYKYIEDASAEDADEIEKLDDKTKRKLRILKKACDQLRKAIKKLEETEVDFDDEEDSAYIKMDKYQQRLNKVYKKYCEILKRHPSAGRLTHEKLRFNYSSHKEINNALNKAYRNNKFPTYYEVEKLIKKCVNKHNLPLNETAVKRESKFCFEKMGNLLQHRRKEELFDTLSCYTQNQEDPAKHDSELRQKLKTNYDEGNRRINEVFEKFARKQEEQREEIVLSEDSDDSHLEESSDTE